MYGETPPVPTMVIEPVLAPLQVTSVIESVEIDTAELGSVIVIVVLYKQPFESLTVTV